MSEENKKELLAAEDTILKDVGGVLEAMETVTQYDTFPVIRNGKKLFSFRVRGLDDEEMEKCRDESTKMVKNKRLGVAVPGEFNSAKFNSLLVYYATHPDDRKWLWDNKELQQTAEVLSGWQVVDAVLRYGEKEAVIEMMEELSGRDDDTEGLEGTIKNS
jgi:hypothetical protein